MSELKVYPAFSVYNRAATLEESLVYLKSEADKEIDFWKKKSHDHYERWFNLNKQYEGWFGKVMRCERAERELRHQKYKRCLAMARLCERKRIDAANYRIPREKWEFYEALNAYQQGDREHCLQELAQCSAVILRMMQYVEEECWANGDTCKGGNNEKAQS